MDAWDDTHGSGLRISGRTVLNLWRIMRSELKLPGYTFEAVVYATMRHRMPNIHPSVTARWHSCNTTRWQAHKYYVDRAAGNLALLAKMDVVGRTSEMARLIGIDFFSVLTRGSQFRVEACLLRVAKPQGYALPSPSPAQVAAQAAMECIPLVMEPLSRFYVSPVLVLDFQSLYPSVIIAYNMCYSTCLGRVSAGAAGMSPRLGFRGYKAPGGAIGSLAPDAFLAPNGALFAPRTHRAGVLPTLLRDILETRLMVKRALKRDEVKGDPVASRVFDARQLALKLIANVTYGYTAAGFSGRMPCAEIADAIVQTGRTILESTIRMVHAEESWKARVVYGDTDSLFVHLEDVSREDAFRIGEEIAARASSMFPDPITLKFEKVYHPCVLLSKKRYVGDMFESRTQDSPVLDCKGIEIVRRDTCPVVIKTFEACLTALFRRKDLSAVRRYLVRQWTKILQARLPLQDFVFAKEVRLGTYARESSLPPAAVVASRMMIEDPRASPQYGERVSYVVVCGEPGARLVDLVVTPHDVLRHPDRLTINGKYYITKQIIPALGRVFNLVGVNISRWFIDMKKPSLRRQRALLGPTGDLAGTSGRGAVGGGGRRGHGGSLAVTTIDQYYVSDLCEVCGALCRAIVCDKCKVQGQVLGLVLATRASVSEKTLLHLVDVCRSCTGFRQPAAATSCISIDCPYFFERCRALRTTQHMFAVLRQTGMLHREPVAAAAPQPSEVVVVDDDIIDLQDD